MQGLTTTKGYFLFNIEEATTPDRIKAIQEAANKSDLPPSAKDAIDVAADRRLGTLKLS